MNRSLITLALLGLSLTASAAPWTGYPNLADSDGDGYPGLVGATAAPAGYTGKIDCRDDLANVHPGATEIIGDGIDQDCSGADAKYPVPDVVAARYLANSGTRDGLSFIAEYDRCKAAAECEVDDVTGTMKIKPANAETHVFEDIYLGSTKVLRADGIREVVTKEEASHFRPGGSASVGSTGIGTRTATRIADERAAAAVAPLRDELTAMGGRVDALEADAVLEDKEDDTRDAEISRLGSAQTGLASRVGTLESTVATQGRAIGTLQGSVGTLKTDMDSVQSHGPLLEAYVLGGGGFGQSVNDDGDIARNPVLGGGGVGLNAGVDGDDYRVNAYGMMVFGGDGSDGPANMWGTGAEYLWQVGDGDAHFGVQGGYAQRSSLVNALETQVLGRLPNVGPTLAVPFGDDDGKHGVFLVRAGVGPEFIGMSSDSVTSSARLGGFVTVGIGGGVGALE